MGGFDLCRCNSGFVAESAGAVGPNNGCKVEITNDNDHVEKDGNPLPDKPSLPEKRPLPKGHPLPVKPSLSVRPPWPSRPAPKATMEPNRPKWRKPKPYLLGRVPHPQIGGFFG